MKACFIYIVTGNLKEAEKISHSLVQKNLAACTNIIPNMLSFYKWEGKLQKDRECIVIAKSRTNIFKKLKAEVLSLHSYSCPCIAMLPIQGGHSEFLKWIKAQTQN